MRSKQWLMLALGLAAVLAIFWLLPPKAGEAPVQSAAEPEENAVAATAQELNKMYEELRLSAEINAQIAADERNMQVDLNTNLLSDIADHGLNQARDPVVGDAQP